MTILLHQKARGESPNCSFASLAGARNLLWLAYEFIVGGL
jgi:hypothetical protein